jgi:hypothetical protein
MSSHPRLPRQTTGTGQTHRSVRGARPERAGRDQEWAEWVAWQTQVAIEYSHRYARAYEVVWWVNTEETSLIGE